MKVLFVLKRREDFNQALHTTLNLSTGLFNSANFVHDMLNGSGVESKIVVCQDNNFIDREVHAFRPDIVFVEALWVVPEKFEILQKLHPKVKWVIRIHSDTPFMAMEGMAMEWILGYLGYKNNMIVAPNSPKMVYDITTIAHAKYGSSQETDDKIVYLPNYYPAYDMKPPKVINFDNDTINISSFGAVRPLKNQLIQAIAAIDFAKERDLKLRFHMNAGRIEGKAQPVDRNLRGLFENLDPDKFACIFHEWAPHEQFKKVIQEIDIGMQVSFSETFNIVGADQVVEGIPFIASGEIPWYSQKPVSMHDSMLIAEELHYVYRHSRENVGQNQVDLNKYVHESRQIWLQFLNGEPNA
jgi:hypothetical protein